MRNQERGVEARRGTRGFTLIELFVVLAVLAVAMALGIPAIQNLIIRSKTEGFGRDVSVLMQRTRLESIKMTREGVVYLDPATNELTAFIDADRDGTYNPDTNLPYRTADYELGRMSPPANVSFEDEVGDTGQTSIHGTSKVTVDGSDLAAAIFQPDGSLMDPGTADGAFAFRVADPRGNVIEIRVAPAGSARIELRKWHETYDGAAFNDWLGAGDPEDANFRPWEWK